MDGNRTTPPGWTRGEDGSLSRELPLGSLDAGVEASCLALVFPQPVSGGLRWHLSVDGAPSTRHPSFESAIRAGNEAVRALERSHSRTLAEAVGIDPEEWTFAFLSERPRFNHRREEGYSIERMDAAWRALRGETCIGLYATATLAVDGLPHLQDTPGP